LMLFQDGQLQAAKRCPWQRAGTVTKPQAALETVPGCRTLKKCCHLRRDKSFQGREARSAERCKKTQCSHAGGAGPPPKKLGDLTARFMDADRRDHQRLDHTPSADAAVRRGFFWSLYRDGQRQLRG